MGWIVAGMILVLLVALVVLSHFSDPRSRDDDEPGDDGGIDDLLGP